MRVACGVDLRVRISSEREGTEMPRGNERYWRRQTNRRERALVEATEWLFDDENASVKDEREVLEAYSF